MRSYSVFTLLVLTGISTAAAADASYFGKWKLNPSKSQLTNTMVSIEKLPSGEFRFDMAGFAYNFKLDGKEYPTPDGGSSSWNALNADTWEVTSRVNGKVVSTIKLALKGNTIASSSTMPQDGGKEMSETSTWKRVSGGPGFIGEWKSTQVNAAATTLELTASGSDGITVSYPEYHSTCTAKFDGKPYPVTTAGSGTKSSLTLRKTGSNSFEMTTLIDGKPWFVENVSVSADGKTLTDNSTPVSKKEPQKTVYDRQ